MFWSPYFKWMKNYNLVKIQLMAELSYWIVLDCTGVIKWRVSVNAFSCHSSICKTAVVLCLLPLGHFISCILYFSFCPWFFYSGAGCLPAACRECKQDVFCHHRPVKDQQHVSLQPCFFSAPLPKGSSGQEGDWVPHRSYSTSIYIHQNSVPGVYLAKYFQIIFFMSHSIENNISICPNHSVFQPWHKGQCNLMPRTN